VSSTARDVLSLMDEWGPEKIVCVSDTRTRMRGVLVIDNTARGMGKGGTRMHPNVTVDEIARLARVMTWKWAMADLFFGGAKAGIQADPHEPDKERILRAFVRALRREVPLDYVFGLDMGLTEDDAAIIQDEVGDRGAAVGTPTELGGVPYDRWGVTGYGVAESVDAALRTRGASLAGRSVVVQGFGAVGASAARRLSELGATIVAISTSQGVLYDPDGLDVASLLAAREDVGDFCVNEYDAGAQRPPLGEEMDVRADIFVPAATQDVVDGDRARHLPFDFVIEGANLPLSNDAQHVLALRGVTVVPDFVANAGGVIAAAYAMDARHSAFAVDRDAILAAVSQRMRVNTGAVLRESSRRGCTSHEAARELASSRVRAAMAAKRRLPSDVASAGLSRRGAQL
jgi:glutamate dehydrogenase (NAD(P)+)